MTDGGRDPLVFEFFNEIGIIAQLSQTLLERSLPDGLKLPHFGVLSHFARLGGDRSPAELARAFQVTRGAMTNTLQRLEARGLVALSPDPRDGRAKRVRITPRGLAAREAAIAALAPSLAALEAQFGAQPFGAALPFLRRIRTHLDTMRDAPA
jgi:DNA-binding MarR family transcriptional regulator